MVDLFSGTAVQIARSKKLIWASLLLCFPKAEWPGFSQCDRWGVAEATPYRFQRGYGPYEMPGQVGEERPPGFYRV
jgi:hypothetical protein